MARKFKHGRMISHKKNRQITAGAAPKKSYNSPYWTVGCEKHGVNIGKDSYKSVRVSPPESRFERNGGVGCPKCRVEREAEKRRKDN